MGPFQPWKICGSKHCTISLVRKVQNRSSGRQSSGIQVATAFLELNQTTIRTIAMPEGGLRAYARHRGESLKAVQKAIQAGRITGSIEGVIDFELADDGWRRNTAQRSLQLLHPSAPPVSSPPVPSKNSILRGSPALSGQASYVKQTA